VEEEEELQRLRLLLRRWWLLFWLWWWRWLLLEGLGGTEEKWGGVVGVDAIALLKQKGI